MGIFSGNHSKIDTTIEGVDSPAGLLGSKGDKGDTSLKGDKDDRDRKGDTGAQGAKGDKGDKGDTGAQGPPSSNGDGSQGPKGDKGDTRAQGPQGPSGSGGSVDLSTVLLLDGSQKMTVNLDMNIKKVINLSDPSGATDASNKKYVDTIVNNILKGSETF